MNSLQHSVAACCMVVSQHLSASKVMAAHFTLLVRTLAYYSSRAHLTNRHGADLNFSAQSVKAAQRPARAIRMHEYMCACVRSQHCSRAAALSLSHGRLDCMRTKKSTSLM